MSDINEKMNETSPNHPHTENKHKPTVPKPKDEDYIDYEEIK